MVVGGDVWRHRGWPGVEGGVAGWKLRTFAQKVHGDLSEVVETTRRTGSPQVWSISSFEASSRMNWTSNDALPMRQRVCLKK
jgi:hypothetical protein